MEYQIEKHPEKENVQVISWTGHQGDKIEVTLAPRSIFARVDGVVFGRNFEVLDECFKVNDVEVVARIGDVLLDREMGELFLRLVGELGWTTSDNLRELDDEQAAKIKAKFAKGLDVDEVVILTTKVIPPRIKPKAEAKPKAEIKPKTETKTEAKTEAKPQAKPTEVKKKATH
jgi:hypothetical protein